MPDKIWNLWTDVPNWRRWDDGLTNATIDGAFRTGATGSILADGRTSNFVVTAVEEGKAYTFRTRLPLGGLNIRRSLAPEGKQWKITHEVWFDGFSKPIFATMFGRKWLKMLPAVVQKVKNIAEQ